MFCVVALSLCIVAAAIPPSQVLDAWDFEVCGLGFLCLAPSPRKSAHSYVLIYSESRLVVDGSK